MQPVHWFVVAPAGRRVWRFGCDAVRCGAVRCGAISECCRESGRMQVVCGRVGVGVGVGGCGKGGLSRKRQGPREGGHKGSRR